MVDCKPAACEWPGSSTIRRGARGEAANTPARIATQPASRRRSGASQIRGIFLHLADGLRNRVHVAPGTQQHGLGKPHGFGTSPIRSGAAGGREAVAGTNELSEFLLECRDVGAVSPSPFATPRQVSNGLLAGRV